MQAENRYRARRLVLTLLVAAPLSGCGGEGSLLVPRPRKVVDVDSSKVDAEALAAMAVDDSVSVIVVGRTQLLEPIGGLERHQQLHAQTTRQALRAEVVTRLRAMASADQDAMLGVLGTERRVRRLWIYNAIAGTFSAAEIGKLSRLSSVEYVYPNVGERVVFPTGNERLSLVIPDGSAPTFDPRRATIAWHLRWLRVDRVWEDFATYGDGVVIASMVAPCAADGG